MNLIIHDPDIAHATHYLLEWLALVTGASVYRRRKARQGIADVLQGSTFHLIVGCLLGAAIGNKAVFWLENPLLLLDVNSASALLLQGQSMVGGLLGGWIGVELAKKITSWTGPRTGDDFVPAILCGILVGRIGCFVAGLHDGTYGEPTSMPWGVDLGDGIARHPTALYEWLAALLALVTWPRWARMFASTPGLGFRSFILGYMVWRVGIDTLKPVPYAYGLGMSAIQWICIAAAGVIGINLFIENKRGDI